MGVSILFQIPIIHGLLFGSIVAATDTVDVAAVFERFSIPRRLNLILEGESPFIDATGVISFNVLKGMVFFSVAFSITDTSLLYIWSMLGALALGSAIGFIGGKILLNKWQAEARMRKFHFFDCSVCWRLCDCRPFSAFFRVVTTLFTALIMVKKNTETFNGFDQSFHEILGLIGIHYK